MSLERDFQADFLQEVKVRFPGCIIVKIEPGTIQGFPDRLVLYRDTWAALEFKRSPRSVRQPNQKYYVDLLNQMAYSSFVHPDNVEEVLNALQRAFQS